jgi:transposase-like protein
MKENKIYTSSFKRQVVQEVLSGQISKEGARKRYGIGGNTTILDWMRVYAGFKTKETGTNPLLNLQAMQIDNDKARLEEEIKRLQSELDLAKLKGRAYQIMVEIAKEQYGLDLEKKSGAKPSKPSKKNSQK